MLHLVIALSKRVEYVYPVEGGTAYGVKTVYDGQGGVDRYELTPLTVTVSRG